MRTYWGFPIRSNSWIIRWHCRRSPSFAAMQYGKELMTDIAVGILLSDEDVGRNAWADGFGGFNA